MPVPFFSVIVLTYNRASEVTRCMESCFSQTFTDFEVFLVGDGSNDDSTEVLKRSGDSRLRIVGHEANRGINPSRYSGVAHSRGEWIVVLDSDWELCSSALQSLHSIIHGLQEDIRVIRT